MVAPSKVPLGAAGADEGAAAAGADAEADGAALGNVEAPVDVSTEDDCVPAAPRVAVDAGPCAANAVPTTPAAHPAPNMAVDTEVTSAARLRFTISP